MTTVSGLWQDSNEIPYEPELNVVRFWLKRGDVTKAVRAAERIAKHSHASGFRAFELIKAYFLSIGQVQQAAAAADRAVRELREHQKHNR